MRFLNDIVKVVSDDRQLVRAITTINRLCLAISCLNVFFMIVYAVSGRYDLIPSTLPTPLMSAVVLLLNRKQYYTASRVLILLFGNLSVLVCVAYFGPDTSMQNFFFPAAAAPFLIFTSKEKKYLLMFNLLPIAFYLLSSRGIEAYVTGPIVLTPALRPFIRIICEVSSVVVTILISFILHRVVDDYHTEMVKEQQEKIEHTRLAGLATMAGGVAHEVNNPLAIIAGRAEQLSRLSMTELDPVKVQSISESIKVQIKRISDIVNSLRIIAFDTKNSVYAPVGFQTLLGKALSFFRESLQDKAIKLTIQGNRDDIPIYCNEAEIIQVLINLIDNAVDAVRNTPEKWIAIAVAISPDRQWLSVRISDSGAGIPASIKPYLMQPFFTTKEIGVGRGLGLTIAKRTLDRHAGKLWLDSQAPRTTFVMALPLNRSTIDRPKSLSPKHKK